MLRPLHLLSVTVCYCLLLSVTVSYHVWRRYNHRLAQQLHEAKIGRNCGYCAFCSISDFFARFPGFLDTDASAPPTLSPTLPPTLPPTLSWHLP